MSEARNRRTVLDAEVVSSTAESPKENAKQGPEPLPKRVIGRHWQAYVPFMWKKVKAESGFLALAVLAGLAMAVKYDWERQQVTGRSFVELFWPNQSVDPNHFLYKVNLFLRRKPAIYDKPKEWTLD